MAVACGAEPSARDAVDVVVQEQLVRCTAVLAGQKKKCVCTHSCENSCRCEPPCLALFFFFRFAFTVSRHHANATRTYRCFSKKRTDCWFVRRGVAVLSSREWQCCCCQYHTQGHRPPCCCLPHICVRRSSRSCVQGRVPQKMRSMAHRQLAHLICPFPLRQQAPRC